MRRGALGAALAAAVLAFAATGLQGARGAARSATSARSLIAYEQGDQNVSVWVVGLEGQDARRLGPGQSPLIAPDGLEVAAAQQASKGPALILYPTSGGSGRPFFDAAEVAAQPLAWSSDSRYVAVALFGTGVNEARGAGLEVIDTHSQRATLVAPGVIFGASFEPGADELVYASGPSLEISARVDLHTVAADGLGQRQITHTGDSLNPLWGPRAIAFDREHIRGISSEPEFQIWTMATPGAAARQLTHLRVPALVDGLQPLGFDGGGDRLLTEYVGQDTSAAWTVTYPSGTARPVSLTGVRSGVQGSAISPDGRVLLVDSGAFEQPPGHGAVETVLFGGRTSGLVIRGGAEPSWTLSGP